MFNQSYVEKINSFRRAESKGMEVTALSHTGNKFLPRLLNPQKSSFYRIQPECPHKKHCPNPVRCLVGVWGRETVEWGMEGCPETWSTRHCRIQVELVVVHWKRRLNCIVHTWDRERPSRTFGASFRERNGGLGICYRWHLIWKVHYWSKNAFYAQIFCSISDYMP